MLQVNDSISHSNVPSKLWEWVLQYDLYIARTSKQLCWCYFLLTFFVLCLFFFSLFFCILALLTWTVSIMKSCMNCTYFCFSWEPRGKREDCLFVPFFFLFYIVYLFLFLLSFQNYLFKNRGRKDYMFSYCLKIFL